jgi:hypothetical protein
MAPFLDCLVSYFGLDENGRPRAGRYFCYHVLAGPGPAAGAGVAVAVTVAVHDEAERCTYCPNFHTVEAGGPAAAVGFLDAYHQHDHLLKVQSDPRDLRGESSRSRPEAEEHRVGAAEDEVEILAGLSAGDRVVVRPGDDLREGTVAGPVAPSR